ncbi:hypothetical protein A2239_03120 [Candidatus Uhrbacteria bacterium RIFOXYA2_FULL_40_9]|nr:MAG: hypothetical protein UT94_C0049G0005 [Candidatus Uhrbacteria bacterium GW2011_GWF2_40_263]OGL93270.1 MAG: hypothetical protein A2239_03120 [Candidatus Uhrbacteria bacterium RIFOXYA2_FULL_40_9]OGL97175.1 MAG: hypothetical protein A2332_00640 [Candidatus Uhrbacteria bacterium RIFOXYB2_FULL_41_18]HBK35068.1 hypothetical protein [Candidatus Uhrbacteria bacterium]HCB55390.1 hypothetical protein [Candidatus Uhrbacteria bacterium]
MKNDILFIGGTHGNEPIGVDVLQELEKERSDFDWMIGNKPALNQKTREFEGNLNRSAPGNAKAKNYASRRASEILTKAQNYRYTIDLHGTAKQTGVFIIITNPTSKNFQLAALLKIKRIVVWPTFSPELEGSLSEYVPCGLEIECGPKDSKKIKKTLKKILVDFLSKKNEREKENYQSILKKREIFEVYGSLLKNSDQVLKEFEKIAIDSEPFFPLLIGSYQESGITCYKMRSISVDRFLKKKH